MPYEVAEGLVIQVLVKELHARPDFFLVRAFIAVHQGFLLKRLSFFYELDKLYQPDPAFEASHILFDKGFPCHLIAVLADNILFLV